MTAAEQRWAAAVSRTAETALLMAAAGHGSDVQRDVAAILKAQRTALRETLEEDGGR